MKLIIGLGNPGKEYYKTRHNVGFMALDYIVSSLGINHVENKFKGLVYEYRTKNEKIIFFKPTTFMNLSGEAVREIINFYNIDIEDIIVLYDEKDLDVGKFKLKSMGSGAGHNGIKNIIKLIRTNNFKRIKIGISYDKNYQMAKWVLSKFRRPELSILNDVFQKVYEAILFYLLENNSFEKTMTKFNKQKI